VQGRADPSVPSPVGPGWPAHKPYPPRHAPLPFPSLPGLYHPAPSSKASRVQRRNRRAQNNPPESAKLRVSAPSISSAAASRPRRSSKSPSSMDRYQRVEKPREESPLGTNEIRITAQGRPRNYITYALALLQVSLHAASSLAFLGPVRWRPFSPWREKKTISIWRGFPHPNCLLRV
jgi:hypothetical protein